MSSIFKGDRVFRKVNHLKDGLWVYVCRNMSLNAIGIFTVESVHYFSGNTYLKIKGVTGLYRADFYGKVS